MIGDLNSDDLDLTEDSTGVAGSATPGASAETETETETETKIGSDGAEGSNSASASASASEEQQVEHDLDALLTKARERDEYLALAQRVQADFENYRKRVARDAQVAEARGVQKVAKELLPALDNLGRALAAAEPRTEADAEHHLAEGIRLVQSELAAALARVGIESFSPEGEPFDPAFHEAMAQHPVEGAESGTVVQVYEVGYRLGDAVLRPARVVVAA